MHRIIVAAFWALSGCLLLTTPVWGQKNNRNKQDEQRENQRVAAAQKDVKNGQSELNEAEQKLRSLMRALGGLEAAATKARSELRETRERVADQMAKAMGIEAALAKVKDTKAALAAYAQPVLEKLHLTDDWKAAKKLAVDSKTDLEQLRENVQLPEDERRAKLDELTKLILRPAELDRLAVLETEEGKRLSNQVNEALAAVEKIRRAIPDEKVEKHPEVVQAHKAVDKAELDIKKQMQNVAAARASMQKSQQHLVQSRQKLQQAQAADARDRNKK